MTPPRRFEWFYRYSLNGDLREISQAHRETILTEWANCKTKREIADMLQIHPGTVRRAVQEGRKAGDARAFAKTRPLTTNGKTTSILELSREQWVIKGLANRLEIHFTKVESALRDVIEDVKAREQQK